MAERLVDVMRGPVTESVHWGDIAVVDKAGKLLYSAGDPNRVICMRSSAKPLQALNVILTGAADHYNLTDRELAIMCASHYGEDFHWRTIEGLLDKMGLTMDHILTGTRPMESSIQTVLENDGKLWEWRENHSDCSGKHCGFLASCLLQGFPIENYDRMENPVQQQVLQILAKICGMDKEEIYIAEDGCGVPVHGLPLYNAAWGFARLANPGDLEPDFRAACGRITKAMNAAPEMVAGTGGFCTELMKHTNGKLVGKMGAEAVYGIGVIGKDLGIAVKIEDGNYNRACGPVVIETLTQLGLLTQRERSALSRFVSPVENKNNHGRVVGEIRTVFTLTKQ